MLLNKYLYIATFLMLVMIPISNYNIANSKEVKVKVEETGLIWVDHVNLGTKISGASPIIQFEPTSAGDLFVEKSPTALPGDFPRTEGFGIYVSAPPPGFFVNGVRICYGIIGDTKSATKVTQLRIAQFDETSLGIPPGTLPPGYDSRLDDASVGSLAPTPSLMFNDPSAFACINSINNTTSLPPPSGPTPACIDTDTGTLRIGVIVNLADISDVIYIRALALQYDLTLPDNVTCPSS